MTDPATQPTDTQSARDGGTQPQAWYGEAHKELVASKQWANPDAVIESYVNLEKLIGAEKAGRTVVLPKDEKDEDGWRAFRARLGVPEKAEEYELPVPKGEDGGEFARIAAGWFHEAGVPKSAAQKIAAKWNEHVEALVTRVQEEAKAESERQLSDLKAEWGGEFEKRAEFARRGLRAYGQKAGLDEHDLSALEQSIGTAKMLRLFHALGETTAEAGFSGGEDGGGFGMTPIQAKEKLDELRNKRIAGEITDRDWLAAVERYGPIAAKLAEQKPA